MWRTVEVDVDLSDFDDEDLIEVLEDRGYVIDNTTVSFGRRPGHRRSSTHRCAGNADSCRANQFQTPRHNPPANAMARPRPHARLSNRLK